MKVISISGLKTTGKTWVALKLVEAYKKEGKRVIIKSIATRLKDFVNYLMKIEYGDKLKDMEKESIRHHYINITDNYVVKDFKKGRSIWVEGLIQEIKDIEKNNEADIVIIDDIRLVEEMDNVEKAFEDFLKIRLIKKDFDKNKKVGHITESGLNDYKNFDLKFYREDLDFDMKDILHKLKEYI